MDPYEVQLKFITQALPQFAPEECRRVFYEVAKRDIRKAIYFLLQADSSPEESLAQLEAQPSITSLTEILHQYCPNKSYQKIVHRAAKGQPFVVDARILERLQQFKRAPRKEVLLQIWARVEQEDELLLAYLQGLKYFSHELLAIWEQIDNCLVHKNEAIVKIALELLTCMPQGVERSLARITYLLRQPEWQFKALSTLQNARDIPALTVRRMIQPIFDAYRKQNTKRNNLLPEFRIIQSIAKNNHVHLTIPDLDLERF